MRVLIAVLGGAVLLFPSLALLFTLTLTRRLDGGEEQPLRQFAAQTAHAFHQRLLVRLTAAFLIAGAGGVGLLNLADMKWAHLIGVACLFGFMISAFLAIAPQAEASSST